MFTFFLLVLATLGMYLSSNIAYVLMQRYKLTQFASLLLQGAVGGFWGYTLTRIWGLPFSLLTVLVIGGAVIVNMQAYWYTRKL